MYTYMQGVSVEVAQLALRTDPRRAIRVAAMPLGLLVRWLHKRSKHGSDWHSSVSNAKLAKVVAQGQGRYVLPLALAMLGDY